MKKELTKELDLLVTKDGERMIKLSHVWKALAYERLTLLEDITVFLQWYYDDEEAACPYSCELVRDMANDLIAITTNASDNLIEKNRRNYEVLEVLCCDNTIGSIYVVEIVKIMDYLTDNALI